MHRHGSTGSRRKEKETLEKRLKCSDVLQGGGSFDAVSVNHRRVLGRRLFHWFSWTPLRLSITTRHWHSSSTTKKQQHQQQPPFYNFRPPCRLPCPPPFFSRSFGPTFRCIHSLHQFPWPPSFLVPPNHPADPPRAVNSTPLSPEKKNGRNDRQRRRRRWRCHRKKWDRVTLLGLSSKLQFPYLHVGYPPAAHHLSLPSLL